MAKYYGEDRPVPFKIRMAYSRNHLTHLIVKGRYKCNGAIGKIPRNRIFIWTPRKGLEFPCSNCFPDHPDSTRKTKEFKCSNCNADLSKIQVTENHCKCGQAIVWSVIAELAKK